MLYAVVFEDNPEFSEMRKRHMQGHLHFLGQNQDRLLAAGPLMGSDGLAAGGLWLVEADSVAQVDALCKQDPLFATGLRKSIRVLEWKIVFGGVSGPISRASLAGEMDRG